MANSSVHYINAAEAIPDCDRLRAAIVDRGRGATQIADALLDLFAQITAALAPIVGPLGVAALYKRSVYVAGQTHPWLLGAHEDVKDSADFAALRLAVAAQNHTEAGAGAGFLLHTFNELLASLIGASLTRRLLSKVWTQLLTGTTLQDESK
ncbi:MAG: hypothetical protein ABI859_14830 [Pseudomonadota bacterium]